MANVTITQRLAELLLHEPLAAYVNGKRLARPQWPWRLIAEQLAIDTGGEIDVTGETLRRWAAEGHYAEGAVPGSVVYVFVLPECIVHPGRDAYADAVIPGRGGRWANVCRECFDLNGCALGVGLGQEYRLEPSSLVVES